MVMKTNGKKIILLGTLVACALALISFMFIGSATRTAKADSVFEFENGNAAYVKITEDGGLRFRLQMDADTAAAIKTSSDELYFYVGTSAILENEADLDALSEEGEGQKAIKKEANKDLIYAGRDKTGNLDGYYYSNVLLDANNELKDRDFAAVAVWGSYKAKMTSTRSLYEVANICALDGNLDVVYDIYNTAMEDAGWYGTAAYPIELANDGEVSALAGQLSADYSEAKIQNN